METEIIVLKPIFGKSFTGEPIESYGSILSLTLTADTLIFRGKYGYQEDGKEYYINEITYTKKAHISKVSLAYDNEDERYFIKIEDMSGSECYNVEDERGLAIITQLHNWLVKEKPIPNLVLTANGNGR